MKFKVGDRVKCINEDCIWEDYGEIQKIVDTSSKKIEYFLGKRRHLHYEYELKLVSPKKKSPKPKKVVKKKESTFVIRSINAERVWNGWVINIISHKLGESDNITHTHIATSLSKFLAKKNL